MKISCQLLRSEFYITIKYLEGKRNFIVDIRRRVGTCKGSASACSSELSSSPNGSATLPPLEVVNHIFISHQHLLPLPTNTNHPNNIPSRRTMCGITRKPICPPSSPTRPYHRLQSTNSASRGRTTEVGEIFLQEWDMRHKKLQ